MKQSGFTLVELLVVISIIGIITTIVVFQQQNANDRLRLDNAANTLALELRKAQTFGLGVQRYEPWAGDGYEYDLGYGVFVEESNPTQVIFFADHPVNGIQDRFDDVDDEIISEITLPGNIFISEICRNGSCITGSELHVVYRRPDPRSYITQRDDSGLYQTEVNLGKIRLDSPNGRRIQVNVNESGRVSTHNI